MQMNHIRLYRLYLLYEFAGRTTRSQAMVVEDSTLHPMLIHIKIITYSDKMRLTRRLTPTVCNITLPSMSDSSCTNFLCNATCRSPVRSNIDLKKSFWHKKEYDILAIKFKKNLMAIYIRKFYSISILCFSKNQIYHSFSIIQSPTSRCSHHFPRQSSCPLSQFPYPSF